MADKGYLWIIVLIGALIAYQGGYLDGIIGGDDGPDTDIGPSDLETTVTLNTRDSLATTDTAANVSYYVFNGDKSYLKGGTTSAGTTSFTVPWDYDYTVLVFSAGTGASGGNAATYYPAEVTFHATKSLDTVNIGGPDTPLMATSNATIQAFRDPIDLNQNISVPTVGSETPIQVVYSVTSAASAVYKPVLRFDLNQTSMQDISIGGLSKITCPARISNLGGRQQMCFQDVTLKSSAGIRVLSGSLKASSSTTPTTNNQAVVDIYDTQMYIDPNYANVGRSAFKEGTEDPNDLSNIGATDSMDKAGDSCGVSNTLCW